MIAALSLLTLIGLSDLLHSRELHIPLPRAESATILPEGSWRKVALIAAAAALTTLSALASPLWALLGLLIGMALWLLSYRAQAIGMAATAVVALTLLASSITVPLPPSGWTVARGSAVSAWQVYEWALAVAAVILLNLATANRIVRMVLRFASAATDSTTQRTLPGHSPNASSAPTNAPAPRAGRVIGVLERYLLIALIAAGQGLAIAGLAAAKSIIRYPEISQTARDGEGLSAEVFFIGTVTSWLCALATVGLTLLAFR